MNNKIVPILKSYGIAVLLFAATTFSVAWPPGWPDCAIDGTGPYCPNYGTYTECAICCLNTGCTNGWCSWCCNHPGSC